MDSSGRPPRREPPSRTARSVRSGRRASVPAAFPSWVSVASLSVTTLPTRAGRWGSGRTGRRMSCRGRERFDVCAKAWQVAAADVLALRPDFGGRSCPVVRAGRDRCARPAALACGLPTGRDRHRPRRGDLAHPSGRLFCDAVGMSWDSPRRCRVGWHSGAESGGRGRRSDGCPRRVLSRRRLPRQYRAGTASADARAERGRYRPMSSSGCAARSGCRIPRATPWGTSGSRCGRPPRPRAPTWRLWNLLGLSPTRPLELAQVARAG